MGKPGWKRVLLLLLLMLPVSATIVLASMYYTEKLTGESSLPAWVTQPAPATSAPQVAQASTTPTPMPEVAPTVGPVLPALVDEAGSVFFRERSSVNILFLGLDLNWTDDTNLPTSKDARSDTMFVLNVNKNGKRLGMLSVPRDLYVELPGGRGTDRINSAYGYGGTNLASQTVMHLLHAPIHHTVVIKIAGAKKLVEALSGVDLKVEEDMNYDDNWGHLHVHLKKGWQHLDAENAIGYARFRHDWEGDRGRIRRQQQFIDAVLAKLKKPGVMEDTRTLRKLATVFKQTVETDLTVAEMVDLARVYKDFDRRRMKTGHVDGEDTYVGDQSVIAAPDPKSVAYQVKRVLLGQNLLKMQDLNVEILNACTLKGAALSFGKSLQERKGCRVVRVNDLKHHQPIESCVVVLEHDPDLLDMAPRLVPNVKVQLVDDVPYKLKPAPETTMMVILGDDWQKVSTPHPL